MKANKYVVWKSVSSIYKKEDWERGKGRPQGRLTIPAGVVCPTSCRFFLFLRLVLKPVQIKLPHIGFLLFAFRFSEYFQSVCISCNALIFDFALNSKLYDYLTEVNRGRRCFVTTLLLRSLSYEKTCNALLYFNQTIF